jgi:hypothetical protein
LSDEPPSPAADGGTLFAPTNHTTTHPREHRSKLPDPLSKTLQHSTNIFSIKLTVLYLHIMVFVDARH